MTSSSKRNARKEMNKDDKDNKTKSNAYSQNKQQERDSQKLKVLKSSVRLKQRKKNASK